MEQNREPETLLLGLSLGQLLLAIALAVGLADMICMAFGLPGILPS